MDDVDLIIERILKAKTLYDVLGLSSNCKEEEIKKVYRNLAKCIHPDKCKKPRATEAFQCLNEAGDVLMNRERRRKYDLELKSNNKKTKEVPYPVFYSTEFFPEMYSFEDDISPEEVILSFIVNESDLSKIHEKKKKERIDNEKKRVIEDNDNRPFYMSSLLQHSLLLVIPLVATITLKNILF